MRVFYHARGDEAFLLYSRNMRRDPAKTYADEETRKTVSYQRAERLEREMTPRLWRDPATPTDALEVVADAWEEADFYGWADNYRAEVERRRKAQRDPGSARGRRQRRRRDPQPASPDPFGALYLSETGGWTRAARIALGLTSDRYLVDERREALLPNGMAVRLLARRPGEGRRGSGPFLRIQVRCICGCWIPVGRMGQHLPARCRSHADCRQSQEMARACVLDRHIRKYRGRCPQAGTAPR